jgi:hypothetical protein
MIQLKQRMLPSNPSNAVIKQGGLKPAFDSVGYINAVSGERGISWQIPAALLLLGLIGGGVYAATH